MIFKQKILIIFIWLLNTNCFAAHDVSNVFFQGDSTLCNMKIEGAYESEGAFLVETTGARYEYVPGEVKIYQGLKATGGNKRLLASISIEDMPKFEEVESTKDHILLWSEQLNIGIYGDSTCILMPKQKMDIAFNGNFKPDYEGRYKGELLLIDDLGGIEIYPQRYETGYEIKKLELGKKDWVAKYILNASERVMIAPFPAREFDQDAYFNSRMIVTHGSVGLGIGNPYGQMPPDSTIQLWAKDFDILVLFFKGLYKRTGINNSAHPYGPYVIENKPEFERLIQTAHSHGLKVAVYCSFYGYYRKFKDVEGFYQQVQKLRQGFGVDGLHIDGLTFDHGKGKIENRILNWEMIRRLRELFGSEGTLILHGTQIRDRHLASPVATTPNIDSYCTAVLTGEGVPFNSVNDPYVRFQVRKYGISNTIGMWRSDGPHPESITFKHIIDTILENKCIEPSYGWVPLDVPPKGKYSWGSGMNQRYSYYYTKFNKLRNSYLKNKQSVNK